MEASTLATVKTCPQCSASFLCDPGGCWCSQLPAVMALAENASCYCPACLKAMIAKKLSEVQ